MLKLCVGMHLTELFAEPSIAGKAGSAVVEKSSCGSSLSVLSEMRLCCVSLQLKLFNP